MANKIEGESLRYLTCPLCLDSFSNATNLSCGHTFCKECLELYVAVHNYPDHIRCPVCRKITKLGEHRVEGLTPNFSLRGLEDALRRPKEAEDEDLSSRYCSLHNQLYKDIFCDDCEEFICLTSCFKYHKGHKVLKYEELERECEEQLHLLNDDGRMRRIHYEEFLESVENERMDMRCHLISLEQKIRESFDKKVTMLQEEKESLLKEVEDIGKKSDAQIDVCIDHQREMIENFESSVRELTENRDIGAYSDALKALHLHCKNSSSISKERIYEEALSDVKRTVKSAKFCPAFDWRPFIGRVESGVEQEAESLQLGSIKSASILPFYNRLKIAKTVDLPNKMCGMAALSHDEVVVGYGDKEGIHCFSLSDEIKPFLDCAVGNVWDIAIQTKGRSVLSHGKSTCHAYKAKSPTCEEQSANAVCRQYKCKEGGRYVMLCSDQDDKIYAVNYNREIYVFKESSPKPLRVVPTGNTRPRQICVTKSGEMITSTCDTTPSTVTVFFRDGRVCGTITASDYHEYLYPAVDSEDRLLVARVRGGSNMFGLCRYKLLEQELTEDVMFKELTLPHCIDSYALSYWCYMVSLTPNRLAFANGTHLYFIDLPTRSSLWDKIWPWSWW